MLYGALESCHTRSAPPGLEECKIRRGEVTKYDKIHNIHNISNIVNQRTIQFCLFQSRAAVLSSADLNVRAPLQQDGF